MMEKQLGGKDLQSIYSDVFDTAKKWYNLGLALGLLPDELDKISSAHRDEPDHCLREILKLWLSKSTPKPTRKALIDALRQKTVGNERLADDLEEKYHTMNPEALVKPLPVKSTSLSTLSLASDSETSTESSKSHRNMKIVKESDHSSTSSPSNGSSVKRVSISTWSAPDPKRKRAAVSNSVEALAAEACEDLDQEWSDCIELHLSSVNLAMVSNADDSVITVASIPKIRVVTRKHTLPVSKAASLCIQNQVSSSQLARNSKAMYNEVTYEFIDSVPEDLLCQYCHRIAYEPHQLKCGKLRCKLCLSSRPYRCSHCHGRHDAIETISDVRSKNQIQSLVIKCPNSSAECPWTGKLSDVLEHRSECTKEIIPCTYKDIGCDELVRRDELKVHEDQKWRFHMDCSLKKQMSMMKTIEGLQETVKHQNEEQARRTKLLQEELFPSQCLPIVVIMKSTPDVFGSRYWFSQVFYHDGWLFYLVIKSPTNFFQSVDLRIGQMPQYSIALAGQPFDASPTLPCEGTYEIHFRSLPWARSYNFLINTPVRKVNFLSARDDAVKWEVFEGPKFNDPALNDCFKMNVNGITIRRSK